MGIIVGRKRRYDFFTINGTNKVVRVGDCVVLRSQHVAKVNKIKPFQNRYEVELQRYYRPEKAIRGRRKFHGSKELFLSDEINVQSASTVIGKCTVHSLKSYTMLDSVGPDDYYSRFNYDAQTGDLTPDRVAVYCKCELPYNPDDLMVQCSRCIDWFHPACVGMTMEQAQLMDPFLCTDSCAAVGAQMEPAPSKRLKKRPRC